jgi:hypothetical protein
MNQQIHKKILPFASELCILYSSSHASEAHNRERVLPVPVITNCFNE